MRQVEKKKKKKQVGRCMPRLDFGQIDDLGGLPALYSQLVQCGCEAGNCASSASMSDFEEAGGVFPRSQWITLPPHPEQHTQHPRPVYLLPSHHYHMPCT
jgi:hypothetical protein